MNFWDELCGLVIRPQRSIYDPSIALGPKLFQLGSKIYERTDLELENPRGHCLKCSHYQPIANQRIAKKLPCVIYCHGNCGCRCDALDAVQVLLPYNITVLSFDFSGSGLSEGEYVSLGFYEQQDVLKVVDYLWKTNTVSKIGLWGRSMGAATSLMYASRTGRHDVSAICCDSPFTSLEEIIQDLVETHKAWVPKMAVRIAVRALRSSIQTKAQFDIKKLCPVDEVSQAVVPVLFGHATGDDFIKIKHSQRLYESYPGDKLMVEFDGDHNSERPDFFYDTVASYFYTHLVENDPRVNKNIPRGSIARSMGVGVQTYRDRNGQDDIFDEELPPDVGSLPHSPRYPQIDLSTFSAEQGGRAGIETSGEDEDPEMLQAMINSLEDLKSQCIGEEEKKQQEERIQELKHRLAKY
eukprot:gb/GECH01000292.1/.p1 GENE.gb/GECH01000292.1/~~gb/GECH01000292.1/.p1  ORF type:complete len:410 (+),score=56.03 gb/GECH01000292.1/:1-1230(+)